jgi:hypothetical protein
VKEKTKKFFGCATIILFLLLVIAIYLPGLLTTKIAVQEASAFSTILSLYEAEKKFQSQNENKQYGSLKELAEAGLIDTELAQGQKKGFRFEVVLGDKSFEAYATPLIYGRYGFTATGSRSFFVNEKNILTNADKQGERAGLSDKRID